MARSKETVAKVSAAALVSLAALLGGVAWLSANDVANAATTWTAFGSLATITAAVVAIWTLVALKRDSADRTRPVILAELRAAVLTRDAEFIVRNVGQSVARDVKVDFDPPLPVLEGDAAEGLATPYLQRRYSQVIPTFPPGLALYNSYQDANDNDEPTPDDFTATITYYDMHGHKYTDSYDLTMDVLRGHTAGYPSNTDDKGMQRREVKALEAIARGIGRH
ncbi:COG1361 family protein [Mycolicibacterium fallax]|uniref:Uncharacterized protein n=1 Tax=Mycolicibacterium fallax TaxID=1793 RepID=A0A1X1RNI1_MYCFA|nr:hypothetical protein [Mycolicibacterium fallax]MCB1256479.1 hypothetical protein [Microthrixaceae bacterium]ORV10050.1 hypothetical protein AWC04_01085 [Mycolicibacterium fallax]BBY98369.1 hypothetical protein MFAL_18360 [Mycolicibacterium fallax]